MIRAFIISTLLFSPTTGHVVWQDQAPTAAMSASPGDHDHPGPVPFSSNGCSGFREAMYFSCCYQHDFAFWAGGNRGDRRKADLALRRCILDVGGDHLSAIVGFILVRLGTIPGRLIDDGWGRAWKGTGRRRYAALTADQQAHVAEERRRLCRSFTVNPRTGGYFVDETRDIRPNQARAICTGR
jgi:hypothetical protein